MPSTLMSRPPLNRAHDILDNVVNRVVDPPKPLFQPFTKDTHVPAENVLNQNPASRTVHPPR